MTGIDTSNSAHNDKDTMRAIVAERFRPPGELEVRTIAVPRPAVGEVRVRVGAVSLNPADWHGVVGIPFIARPAIGWFRPKRGIPGTDVAGTVDAVGAGVTRFSVGDAVFGFVDGGGCAEFVCVSAANLVARPAGVSVEAAAAVGVAAFTALNVVRDVARLEAGVRVLVNGATGGVGHFAVQMAKALDCEVTAVCGAANVEAAHALGADHVLDYASIDFTRGPIRYDAILDNPGNHPLRACRGVLEPDGVYVLIGGGKAPILGPIPRLTGAKLLGIVSSQRFELALGKETPEDLKVLRAMLEAGSIQPVVGRTMSLDDVPGALAEIGRGHTCGKLVACP